MPQVEGGQGPWGWEWGMEAIGTGHPCEGSCRRLQRLWRWPRWWWSGRRVWQGFHRMQFRGLWVLWALWLLALWPKKLSYPEKAKVVISKSYLLGQVEEMESCVDIVSSWRIRYKKSYHEDLDVYPESIEPNYWTRCHNWRCRRGSIEHARREGRRGKLEQKWPSRFPFQRSSGIIKKKAGSFSPRNASVQPCWPLFPPSTPSPPPVLPVFLLWVLNARPPPLLRPLPPPPRACPPLGIDLIKQMLKILDW